MKWQVRISLICMLLCSIGLSVIAQTSDYTPSTKWPYLYDEFLDGTVFFTENQKVQQAKLNVHLQNCTLHYLEEDKVLQSNPRNIEKILIGNDTFIYMNGELVRLIKADDKMLLVKLIKADLAALSKGESGAYGMGSEASAVQQLSSIQMGGISNLSHTQMKLEKSDGKDLPLIEEYYFIINNKIIEATKKEIEKSLTDASKDKLKAFIKQNKIKWKDENSLVKLLEFFHQ